MIALTMGIVFLVWTMTLGIAGWWSGVVDAWNNFFGGIEQRIVDFVRNTVQTVADWATGWFDSITSRFFDIIDLAYTMARGAAAFAQSLVDGVYGWTLMVVTNLQNWVGNWINDLIERIRAVSDYAEWLQRMAEGYVIGIAEDLYNRVIAEWVLPLGARIDSLYNGIVDYVLGVIGSWIAALEDRVTAAYEWLVAPVVNAVAWIANEGVGAVSWVRRYGAMVAAIVDDPLGWLQARLGTIIQGSARWFLGNVLAAVNAEGSVLEDWVVRWLGA